MTKQFILISALVTFGLFTTTFAHDTGPMLPKPILVPLTTGEITVKAIKAGDLNTFVLVIEDDAARLLYNSLKAQPPNKRQQTKPVEENRIGRNVKCTSRNTHVGSKQKITCLLSITDGEYLDLGATQIPEIKLQSATVMSATVRTQIRGDGVQMTMVGVRPKSNAIHEIFDSLDAPEFDSKKTKNMISCSKTQNTAEMASEDTMTCTTFFKDGIALLAPIKN